MPACEGWDVAPSWWKYPIESSTSSGWFTKVLKISVYIYAALWRLHRRRWNQLCAAGDIPHQTPIFSEWRGFFIQGRFLFISHTTNVLLFKFRCSIFIDVRIIKEMPGSVASGTLCIAAETKRNGLKCSAVWTFLTCCSFLSPQKEQIGVVDGTQASVFLCWPRCDRSVWLRHQTGLSEGKVSCTYLMEHAGNGCHADDKHYGSVYEFAGMFLRVCVHVCACVCLWTVWLYWRVCLYVYVCPWDTPLQTARSLVRFPTMSLIFFIDIILPAALWPLGRLSF